MQQKVFEVFGERCTRINTSDSAHTHTQHRQNRHQQWHQADGSSDKSFNIALGDLKLKKKKKKSEVVVKDKGNGGHNKPQVLDIVQKY